MSCTVPVSAKQIVVAHVKLLGRPISESDVKVIVICCSKPKLVDVGPAVNVTISLIGVVRPGGPSVSSTVYVPIVICVVESTVVKVPFMVTDSVVP